MIAEIVIKLKTPVPWGKDEVVEQLVLKPTARAFRDVSLPLDQAKGTIDFRPYLFAVVGVRMSGRPSAETFVDRMDPSDMMEVATAVLNFLAPAPRTGTEPSQS